jgi:hypothetical protein
MRRIFHMFKVVSAFILSLFVAVGASVVTSVPVSAVDIPPDCDFITGGGFVFTDAWQKATFGSHGGCKNKAFWGHVNYVDHGGYLNRSPYHVDSTLITGYFFDQAEDCPNPPTNCPRPTARHICGLARTNAGETVFFHVKMEDNGEPGTSDRFGIQLSNGYLVTTRTLGNGGPGGGNIQLHKPNPSTTFPDTPPDCNGVDSPGP